ncbi:MAG: cbb3-type cytochrome c oxidase subunit I [Candidatus Heimdallarchaeota archaeon]|nr:cbb3-type cytochrome c oxidase subunit I [Candidatus Heimdallarchaeota archaeon]
MTTEAIKQKPWFFNPKLLFGTTDHKQIGILYMVFALVNLAISGWYILKVRVELYNPGIDDAQMVVDHPVLVTAHGFTMIFFVIMAGSTGFGNYMVPKMIGAKDLYWPRWNNIAFWMLIPGAFFVYTSAVGTGWTLYPPLSSRTLGLDILVAGLVLAGSSAVIGAVNFLLTIFTMRRPGLSLKEMDLFSWSIVWMSLIQFVATPIITVTAVMLLFDQALGTSFFTLNAGSGPALFQDLFWGYSHPAVYIMILPGMGLTSMIISRFSQRKVFGHTSMIISMGAIAILGFMVWGHHMFTVAIGTTPNWIFTFLTFLIGVPSGIKTFNWVFTMYKAKIRVEGPLLFSLGYILGFVLGGVTGIMVNTLVLDYVFHDTYFVVGHFHFIIIGGSLSTLIGAIFFLYPSMSGKMYNRTLAFIQFAIWIPGYILTFQGMNMTGLYGMPRRYADYQGLPYLDELTFWHRVTTIGAFLQLASFLLMFGNLFYSYFKGPVAGDNPFRLKIPTFWEETA